MQSHKKVMQVILDAGFECYIVGGYVRDQYLHRHNKDIDMATNATPDQMVELFKAKGFRLIMTGIKHGTLTVMCDGEPFEITTYRRDVATEGRNATVEFAKTKEEDAQRRDFTMNALYMDINGAVYDPTGRGVADIEAGYITFVGDADTRCKEDYLRIFRAFRFQATLGMAMDDDVMSAIRRNINGISRVSDERKWTEIKKMLEGKHLSKTLYFMCQAQVSSNIFSPLKYRKTTSFIYFRENREWHEAYFAMFGAEMYPRMSKEEKAILFAYKAAEKLNPAQIAYMMKKQDFDFSDIVAVSSHWHDCKMAHMASIVRGMDAVFPLKSTDFTETGPDLGKAMRAAETAFVNQLH